MRRFYLPFVVLLVATAGSACSGPSHLRLLDTSNKPIIAVAGEWSMRFDWSTAQPRVTVTVYGKSGQDTTATGALNATGTAAILDGTQMLADDWDAPYDACFDDISDPCSQYTFDSDQGRQYAEGIGGTPEGAALEAAIVQIAADVSSCTPKYLVPDAPASGC